MGQSCLGTWVDSASASTRSGLRLRHVDNKQPSSKAARYSQVTVYDACVFLGAVAASGLSAVAGGMKMPQSGRWGALTLLVILYEAAFSALFVLMLRLEMARNAPAMNIEPVAELLLGWMVLDQQLRWFVILVGRHRSNRGRTTGQSQRHLITAQFARSKAARAPVVAKS